MTWDEFKELVDTRLGEQGADSSIEIWYIDICYPHRELEINTEKRTSYEGKTWLELTVSE